jgi:hypothetical protein
MNRSSTGSVISQTSIVTVSLDWIHWKPVFMNRFSTGSVISQTSIKNVPSRITVS